MKYGDFVLGISFIKKDLQVDTILGGYNLGIRLGISKPTLMCTRRYYQ
jgi:hypothetical protein